MELDGQHSHGCWQRMWVGGDDESGLHAQGCQMTSLMQMELNCQSQLSALPLLLWLCLLALLVLLLACTHLTDHLPC